MTSKIIGTVVTSKGSRIFAFDIAAKKVRFGGCWAKDGHPDAPEAAKAAATRAVGEATDDEIRAIRIGTLHCHACDTWIDAATQPQAWSYGMCASCSLDREYD